jgi:cobalt-zinc-cadmium efflux system outer membrane protein
MIPDDVTPFSTYVPAQSYDSGRRACAPGAKLRRSGYGAIAQEHHHHHIEPVKPLFPRLGKGQEEIAGTRYMLDQLERMALALNPTMAEAEAAARSAEGKRLQAGLYPNPRLGFEGDELRGGSYGGGERGVFIAQPIITAGKLGLNRKIVDRDIQIARRQAEAQRYRVLNAVRTAYMRVLAVQEMVETRKDLSGVSKDTLKVAQQLHNIGQADDTEVLEAEIEDQQAEIGIITEENTLRRLWTGLWTVVGKPGVPAGGVTGELDTGLPQLTEETALASILKDSPAIKMARAGIDRAEAMVKRARVETIPNLELKGALQQNGERLAGSNVVGLQGFAEIGVELHVFDRDQGNVQAARAEVDQARHELERVNLSLRDQTSNLYRGYRNAKVIADRYGAEILPRARKAYDVMLQRYGLTLASFTSVLNLQRLLFRLEVDYIAVLENLKTNAVMLDGFLLSGGLGTPSMMEAVEMPAMLH